MAQITLTMIVKDEAERLPGALASARGVADELIIVGERRVHALDDRAARRVLLVAREEELLLHAPGGELLVRLDEAPAQRRVGLFVGGSVGRPVGEARYEGGQPCAVDAVVLSTQHDEDISQSDIHEAITGPSVGCTNSRRKKPRRSARKA